MLHQQASLPDDLEVVVFVPDFEMPTQESRRKLPRQLSREDAVFNVSHAALLVAALAAGNYDVLDEATQDRIHQPVRSEIFTGLVPIMTAAKEGGRVSFVSFGRRLDGCGLRARRRGGARRAADDAGGDLEGFQRPQHRDEADGERRARRLEVGWSCDAERWRLDSGG